MLWNWFLGLIREFNTLNVNLTDVIDILLENLDRLSRGEQELLNQIV